MNLIANQSKNKQEMIGAYEELYCPLCGHSISVLQTDKIDL